MDVAPPCAVTVFIRERGVLPEQRLWQAVLLEALAEAGGRRAYLKDGLSPHAAQWVNLKSRDFREVCELAGFDPKQVFDSWQRLGGVIPREVFNEQRGRKPRGLK